MPRRRGERVVVVETVVDRGCSARPCPHAEGCAARGCVGGRMGWRSGGGRRRAEEAQGETGGCCAVR
jgi:hypothetical protein